MFTEVMVARQIYEIYVLPEMEFPGIISLRFLELFKNRRELGKYNLNRIDSFDY